MPTVGSVSMDGRSFLVGGERVWLASGESHYFRHTADCWEDVLWRIKRAGLNTVATYVAWNRHEPREGAFDFTGDLDLGRFLDLAAEMGLYVFARPGPYICSEWTGGGLPAWLQAKPDIYLREDNPPYMAAVKAFWDRLIPIIAERQVDRGGAVILVQAENEYRQLYCEARWHYIEQLVTWLREYGITVPITGCNAHSHDGKTIAYFGGDARWEPRIDDLVLTYNTGLDAEPLEDLHRKQPDAPLFTTEQWCGGLMPWGRTVSDWPALNQHAAGVMAMLGCGSMVNYYMFEGGTNFGYNGGQWFATSYASSYPVGEAGQLQEKYWALKPLNHLQQCLGDWFATSEACEEHGWTGPDGAFLRLRQTDRGTLLFFGWRGMDASDCELSHPDRESIGLSLGASPHAILPIDFNLFGEHVITQSNASLLWLDAAHNTVFLYAAAGADVAIELAGERLEARVARHKPVALQSRLGLDVIVLDEYLAGRFWPMDDGSIQLGGYFVTGKGAVIADHNAPLYVYANGKLARWTEQSVQHKTDRTRALSDWKTWSAVDALSEKVWRRLDAPVPHESLGVYEGGLWYRAYLDVEEGGWQNLLVPAYGAGLINVYHNGTYAGVLGESRTRERPNLMERPRDQWREQLSVYLRPGRNTFLFYSEDMGRPAGGTPAPRGLAGDVFAGARPLACEQLVDIGNAPVSLEVFRYLRYEGLRERSATKAIDFRVTCRPNEEIYLCFILPLLDLFADCFAVNTFAVEVDGNVLDPVGLPSCEMNAFKVPTPNDGGDVGVRVFYQGSRQVLLNAMKAWGCPRTFRLDGWAWAPFAPPETVPADADGISMQAVTESRLLFPVSLDDKVEAGGCRPTWYASTFTHPGAGCHFLRIGKLMKGQLFLNGRHVGRYWQKPPATQSLYYLPSAWMQRDNQLTIFEESGSLPVSMAIVSKDEQ